MDRLKTMETFVKIARAGSYAKAAEQLGMARSQVTKHLQQLEDHLQVRLIHRTTRQVALTEIGLDYYDFCQRVLGEIDEKEQAVSQRNLEPRGQLKIAAPMGLASHLLAPLIAEFMLRHPMIEVTAVLSDLNLSPVEMIDGNFDLAIQTGPLADASTIARRLGSARWIACAAPGYLARAGAPATAEALGGHNCLVHRKTAPSGLWHFRRDGRPVEVQVQGTLSSNSVMLLKEAVVAGVGIGLLPGYAIGPELADGRIVPILPDCEALPRPVHVLFAHPRFVPNRVRLFVDFLAERLREI